MGSPPRWVACIEAPHAVSYRFMGLGPEDSLSGVVEALFRSDRVIVAVVDREMRFVRVNETLALVNSHPVADHIGQRIRDIIGPFGVELEGLVQSVFDTNEALIEVPLGGDRVRLRCSFLPEVERGQVVVLGVEDSAEPGAELRQRLRFEAALAEISAMMVGVSDDGLDEAINQALGIIGRLQELDQMTLHLFEPESTTVVTSAQWRAEDSKIGSWETARDPTTRYPWSAKLLYEGSPVVVENIDELPDLAADEREDGKRRGVGAYITVPLVVDDRPLGAVSFFSAEPRLWRKSFIARVQLFAETVAGAVRRRQLHREADAARCVERVIDELSRRFVASTESSAMVEAVKDALQLVCDELGYPRALIFRLLAEEGEIEVAFDAGQPGAMVPGDRFPLARVAAMAGAGGLQGTAPFVLQSEQMPAFATDVWRARGFRGAIVCPLLIAGRLTGLVALLTTAEHVSGRQQENARLVQQLFATVLARLDVEYAREQAFAELSELKAKIEHERDYLREEVSGRHGAPLAESAGMREALEKVRSVAQTTAAVLLQGETGAGKEVIARHLHAISRRADQPLVKVNCASIPSELFESEFFGHVRGAFTGAHRDRRGRFELADGGTLFLDEVGEIPLELQPKLLRTLQEGELERVGDDKTRKVDVRIIAATNRDLQVEIEEGRFRADLYYRLGVFPIHIPPLRDRREDIVPLAKLFLERHAIQLGREGLAIGPAEREQLHAYDWPGNVRELNHVIERAVILSPMPPLRLDLPEPSPPTIAPPSVVPPRPSKKIRTQEELEALERQSIEAALAETGKVSGPGGAAELLGLRPSTLRDRMRAYGIRSPRQR